VLRLDRKDGSKLWGHGPNNLHAGRALDGHGARRDAGTTARLGAGQGRW
jgi:hypothetical protein